MIVGQSSALSLFYCYAHEDASLREKLDKHLAMLRQLDWVQTCSDLDIKAGGEWQQTMDHYLDTADILLLLISSDFIASDYYYRVVLQRALHRHRAGEAIVIPIILRPVEWEQTPLSTLSVLPRDGRPITQWSDPDQALKQVATEIRAVAETLQLPAVVAATSQQQTTVNHLISFLEAHGVPTIRADYALEAMKLHEAIRKSSATVLIASSETHSTYLLKETRNFATMYQRPIIDIQILNTDQSENQEHTLPKEQPGTPLVITQQQKDFSELLHHLKALRHRAAFPIAMPPSRALTVPGEPRNPYKSLQAFTSHDTRDFFGRSALIHELTQSIETMISMEKRGGESARLLAVIGPSGSGKSSIAMAGLLPCLQAGEIAGSKTWIYLDPLVPGEHPLEALALTLFEHFPEKSLQTLSNDLSEDTARGLHLYATALAKRAKNAATYIVLVIDQFEELFTLTTNAQRRQQFIDLLVTACTQRRGPLIIILTLRADFYDRPMQYPSLYTLIEKRQVAMLPMSVDDLRAVITSPATLPDVQLTFEENLVGDLLFDVQGQAGALPLLQFTLDQLFHRRDERQLTRQAYKEMGGIKGALSQHAELTYQELLSQEHRRCARALFLRLIDPGVTEQDSTRRRASLSEFKFADPSQTQYMQETVERFIDARLLTANQSAGRTTLEVSHEAVIREWVRLADWLREARDDIRLQQTISKDATTWMQRNKSGDHLYRGSQLKEARAWARRNIPSNIEMTFLHASTVQYLQAIVRVIILAFFLFSTTGIAIWFLTRPDPTHVTTLNNDGQGSLRQAIALASSKGSTITFDANLHGTILLSSTNLDITKNLTIRGPGTGKLSISSGKSGKIFRTLPGASVNISDLSFKDSNTSNGFVENEGTLTMNNCTISGNSSSILVVSPGGDGGGIYNSGTLTLNNSIVSHNRATESGGGIYNFGTLIINNSSISDNMVTNASLSSGGGIYNYTPVRSDEGTGTLKINNSIISGNKVDASDGRGGGIYNDTPYGTAGEATTLVLNNSTISNNVASKGGGIYNIGTFEVINSTISGNRATSQGGGIAFITDNSFPFSTGMLLACTVYGNFAGEGGGIWTENLEKSSLLIGNTIVAGNSAQPGPDTTGSLVTLGYNLISNRSSTTFSGLPQVEATDELSVPFANLKIDPELRDNGGSTKPHVLTLALFPGSPAIDAIPRDACSLSIDPTDQRGVKRPQESRCDIGAYEYQLG